MTQAQPARSAVLGETRAVVFDLDDTLYPQRQFKLSGFRALAAHAERSGHADQATVLAMLEAVMDELGENAPNILNEAFARLGLHGLDVEAYVRRFRTHRPDITLYPGVLSMLRRLASRMRLGLLTDGLADVQRNKVEALGLESELDAVVCSGDVGLSKPDPRLYEGFEHRFGLSGEVLMYVGDNPLKDFAGANARGWQTVRVRTGAHARTHASSPDHQAQHDLQRVTDLPALLGSTAIVRLGQVAQRPPVPA